MTKLMEKLPAETRDNGEFFEKFDDMVWSDADEPSVFEERWQAIMSEFGLVGHKWFENLYEIRSSWIPAYFRDVRMSGLFRTTSPSESENSFFKRFFSRNANLSEIFIFFENAVESQREDHDALTLVDQTCTPKFLSKHPIERYAATVYTRSIFLLVQKEFELCMNICTISRTVEGDGCVFYDVDDDLDGVSKVTYDELSDCISCACNLIVRKGLICSHMFAVMRARKYKVIPDKYIVGRWTKGACAVFDDVGQNRYAAADKDKPDGAEGIIGLAFKCSAIAEGDDEAAEELMMMLDDFYAKHTNVAAVSVQSKGKQKVIEKYYGGPQPETTGSNNPKVSKTKGCCSRLKPRREAAIKRAQKAPRWCKKCNTRGFHDSRNCPNPIDT